MYASQVILHFVNWTLKVISVSNAQLMAVRCAGLKMRR